MSSLVIPIDTTDLAVQIATLTTLVQQTGTQIMATLDDLNKAVADVQAAVQTAVTLIQSLHTNPGTVTDAEVESAVSSLESAATALGGAKPMP